MHFSKQLSSPQSWMSIIIIVIIISVIIIIIVITTIIIIIIILTQHIHYKLLVMTFIMLRESDVQD